MAHQKLSAGEDQRTVRAFLEGHRMSHILDHEDLHQTLAQLPEPHPTQRSSALAATQFVGRMSVSRRSGVARSARRVGSGMSAGKSSSGPARGERSPSGHRRAAAAAAALEAPVEVSPVAKEIPVTAAAAGPAGLEGGARARKVEGSVVAAGAPAADVRGGGVALSGLLRADGGQDEDNAEAPQGDLRSFAGDVPVLHGLR